MTIGYDFLAGGGEMGERIRAFDWSKTPLGSVESWSPALRMMVRFLLANRFPLLLWWGPQYVSIYNNPYRPVLGAKHPWGLGKPVSECWSEIWHILRPLIDTPFNGGPATWNEDIALEIKRHDFVEETHFTIAYSPVPDESVTSGIGGVLATVHEISDKVVAERRIVALRDLGARVGDAKTAEEACAIAARTLEKHDKDVPFVLLYLIDPDGTCARLAGAAGVGVGQDISRLTVNLDETPHGGWPLAAACRTGAMQIAERLAERFAAIPQGPWSDPPNTGVVVPIPSNKARQQAGLMVAGVSARLRLDEYYRDFFDLVRTQVATAIANARAYEEEKKRAEALAEIDRAKTTFFSNVSHEFRTPLTLILGPVDEILAKPEGGVLPENRKLLTVVQRNCHRLLKLVNTLLEFSRIEAGRTQASYEPVDLAALTAGLASNFRSACERGGLQLEVDCAPLAEPAYVDREMWEKIVLNLTSNAFKFTFEGEIAVRLRDAGMSFELTVRDTGVGIPTEELPHIFERFHRVRGARGRSHEGSGIGLALVQELVKLHGGTIGVSSVAGKGTTFTLSIPKGSAHLPADRIGEERAAAPAASGAGVYVGEALSWLPARDGALAVSQPLHAQRILLADDNTDLREYAQRLLAEHYEVEAVGDGEVALAAARARRPDLIVSDVMMPQLDGFGLIRELRADAKLRDVPVIVLSARAGEEARIEGLSKGADDYLVKPFSARELLVRVGALLQSAEVRRQTLEQQRQATEVLREADRRKDEFLAMLSHELRNPLTPICSAVELLGAANGDEQLIAQARGILTRQVNSLLRLVDDLLDLSRISQGGIVLRTRVVDLAGIVASSIETSRPGIAAAGHELEIRLPGRPVMLRADSVRIAQILTNLLNNAAKYTRPGGRIELTAQYDRGEVAISVRDNGIGIAPEMLPHVFDMFVKATDENRGARSGGLGIGLWLARTLAERHGGGIQARSEGPGRGSEFIVRLPVLEPGQEDSIPTGDEAVATATARRVLVVEDDADAAASLGMLLRQMGHEVRIVHDGQAATRVASEHAPDVVLLDIGLPDIDGYAVAERLRKDLRLQNVPIVAVTGRGREEDRQRSLEAGFREHLMKPVAAETLRTLLSRC